MKTKADFPATRHRNRHGRCYEIAGIAMLDLPENTEWRLCHGVKYHRVTGIVQPLWIGHAWLARGDLIWDPVENRTYAADDYRCKVRASYTRAELCKHIAAGDTWGPWIDIPHIDSMMHWMLRPPDSPLRGNSSRLVR
jgi:hypothetical protein